MGVFDRDYVLGTGAVHEIQHRRERRRRAAPRGPRHEDYGPLLARQPPYDLRQPEILEPRHPERDETHRDRDRPPLPEGVDPESAHPRDRVGKVRLPILLELPISLSGLISTRGCFRCRPDARPRSPPDTPAHHARERLAVPPPSSAVRCRPPGPVCLPTRRPSSAAAQILLPQNPKQGAYPVCRPLADCSVTILRLLHRAPSTAPSPII